MTRLDGWEATEAALPVWERDEVPVWDPLPPGGRGTKPASWSHADWPTEDAT